MEEQASAEEEVSLAKIHQSLDPVLSQESWVSESLEEPLVLEQMLLMVELLLILASQTLWDLPQPQI